jgi:N-acetylglucosamine-6-sulfatase
MPAPTRRDFLKTAVAAGVAAHAGASLAGQDGQAKPGPAPDPTFRPPPKPPRPNILIVLSDDHRYDAMGYLGGGPYPGIRTPHMDALAAAGCTFANAFVTTSLCSPSRASMLTGLYAHIHQVLDNRTQIPRSLVTYPELLQKAGYATAYVGKWHMGYETDEPRPGFDHWASFVGQGSYADQPFNINGVRQVRPGYTTDAITALALEWLRGAPKDRPFCLCVGHKAPHEPFTPPERYKGAYDTLPLPKPMPDTDAEYAGLPAWVRRQRRSWHGVDGMYDGKTSWERFNRDYPGAIQGVDDSLGALVAAVRERGTAESTMVVYLSDNGFQVGEHGLIDKRVAYEPSIRIPWIVSWPGVIAPGTREESQILNIDFASMVLDAARVPIPGSFQGRSPLPLLRGERVHGRGPWLYEYSWEFDFPQTPTLHAVRTQRFKYIRPWGVWDVEELYDLIDDPGERKNLAADPAHAGTLKDLREELDRLLKETGSRSRPTWQGDYAPLGLCEDPFNLRATHGGPERPK